MKGEALITTEVRRLAAKRKALEKLHFAEESVLILAGFHGPSSGRRQWRHPASTIWCDSGEAVAGIRREVEKWGK